MIIDKLTLKSFGKFENKEIPFSPGLNIFLGNNESGKSTVATAIKTFFYADLLGKGKYKKNYIPLSSANGFFDIDFTLDNGQSYTGLVNLGKSNGKTLIKTVNKATGSSLNIDSLSQGEYFFNLSEEMFDSVCYIKDLESISNVIVNRSDVHDELSKTKSDILNIDLSDILKTLKDKLLDFQRKSPTGLIHPTEERLKKINEILNEFENIKSSLEKNDKLFEDLVREEKTLKTELEKLTEAEAYLKRYKEYEHTKKQLKIREQIAALNAESESIPESFFEIPKDDLEKIKSLPSYDKKRQNAKIPLITGIAFGVLSLVLSFLSPYFLLLLAAAVFCFINFYKIKLENKKAEEEAKEYDSLLSKYNITGIDDYYKKREEFVKKSAERKLKEEKVSDLSSQLTDFKEEYRGIYLEAPAYSESSLNIKKEEITKRLTEIKIALSSIEEKRKNAFNNMPDYDLLLSEKEELLKKLSKLREEEEIVKDCHRIFSVTNNSFKASYIPHLNSEVKSILNEIFTDKLDYFNIKDDLTCEIRKESSGTVIPKDYFSRGTDALIYFALRLAIYKLISGKEKIPLILDDCFAELDDERFEKIMIFLSNFTDSQIIYFTSHKRILNLTLANGTINRL